jgi:hypothetical protein
MDNVIDLVKKHLFFATVAGAILLIVVLRMLTNKNSATSSTSGSAVAAPTEPTQTPFVSGGNTYIIYGDGTGGLLASPPPQVNPPIFGGPVAPVAYPPNGSPPRAIGQPIFGRQL